MSSSSIAYLLLLSALIINLLNKNQIELIANCLYILGIIEGRIDKDVGLDLGGKWHVLA